MELFNYIPVGGNLFVAGNMIPPSGWRRTPPVGGEYPPSRHADVLPQGGENTPFASGVAGQVCGLG